MNLATDPEYLERIKKLWAAQRTLRSVEFYATKLCNYSAKLPIFDMRTDRGKENHITFMEALDGRDHVTLKALVDLYKESYETAVLFNPSVRVKGDLL